MATYFDSTAQADKNLLPPEFRAATDLANVAADAEKDVIEQYAARSHYSWYTARVNVNEGGAPELVNTNLGIYVFLRGYKADAAHVDVDPDLKDALKRTVADVITWRLRQHNADPLVASQSSVDGKSTTWRDSAVYLFPRGFDRRLRRFDLRELCWGM